MSCYLELLSALLLVVGVVRDLLVSRSMTGIVIRNVASIVCSLLFLFDDQ